MFKRFTTLFSTFSTSCPWWLLYVGLVVVGLFFRLLALGLIPPAIHHDEIYYAVEAQTIALTAQDPSGTWHPWELRPAHVLYAELPGTLFAFGRLFSQTPLIAARITSVVAGVLLPLALAWFAWGLFKRRDLSLITATLAMFNPWIFQFSRLTFDSLLSLVFYFFGLAILVSVKGKSKIWSLIFLLLGFFQYQGLKIVFIPMILITVLYVLYQENQTLSAKTHTLMTALKRSWPMLLIAVSCCILMGGYVIRLKTQSAGVRIGDIIFFNQPYLSRLVDEQRRLSVLTPLTPYFSNKGTIIVWELIYKYVQAFHPALLFVVGEQVRNPFSVWSVGVFHLVDLLLIIFGAARLWTQKKWRSQSLYLLGLLLIAPLPLAINTVDVWVLFRASFLFPLLIIVAALGWNSLWQAPVRYLKFGMLSAYSLTLIWFGYQYFFRYPIYSTTGTAFAERVMSNYIQRLKVGTPVLVLGDQSEFLFYNVIFHNRLITKAHLPQINAAVQSRRFRIDQVDFDTRCVSFKGEAGKNVIISDAVNVICDGEKVSKLATESARVTNIASPIDSGTLFKIYNDPLCTQYSINSFSRIQDWQTLAVEKLSDEEFCKRLFIYTL